MENIKTKLALLFILAVIGIVMVLAVYFTGILDHKKEAVNQTEGADKGIAIILKPAQGTGAKEINASMQEETYEISSEKASEKLRSDANEAFGRAGVTEEKTTAATGAAEAVEAESIGDMDGGENYTDAYASVPVQTLQHTLEISNASPLSENLQQNITNSLNIVVVQKGQVMSNETVNLEDE